MTLMIIFGVILLVGIGFCVWQGFCGNYYSDWKAIIGVTTIVFMIIGIVINSFAWIPSAKNSEIYFNQLIAEKETIELILETDKDVDRVLLNKFVIEYNNKVIEVKANFNRFICKDYYNHNLNWEGLELIKWK